MTDHTPVSLSVLNTVWIVVLFVAYAWTLGAIGHAPAARVAVARVHELLNGTP